MENIETTNADTAPAIEVAAAPTPAPRKPRKKASTLPTIARRKVMTGQHKKTGAPKLEIIGLHAKRLHGPFTRKDLFDLNGQTISMLTIKKRVEELKQAGKLVQMAKSLVNGSHHGRPAVRFNFDLTQGEVIKPKVKRTRKVRSDAGTHVPDVEIAPAAVEPAAPIVPAVEPAPAVEAAPAVNP